MNSYTRIDKCRVCGGEIVPKLSFGDHPLANDLRDEPHTSQGLFPIEIIQCESCLLHQTSVDVDPKVLFGSHYYYSTPVSLQGHFRKFAEDVCERLKLGWRHTVVSIGDNNGTLCEFFKERGLNIFNIDPSQNVVQESRERGVPTVCEFFSKEYAEWFVAQFGKVDLVVSCNCFCHSPTIASMMEGVSILLKETGAFVQENSYYLDTLKNRDLGQHYLEHFLMQTITSLDNGWQTKGLCVYDVEFNEAQCGSFRAFIGNKKRRQGYFDAIRLENRFLKPDIYIEFVANLSQLKTDITRFFEINDGKTVGMFGVTAKAVLLLRYLGLDKTVKFAVDESTLKQGKFLPETNILIHSAEYFRQNPPDITFVGAYNFADPILERFKDVKTQWVVPLPEFRVI